MFSFITHLTASMLQWRNWVLLFHQCSNIWFPCIQHSMIVSCYCALPWFCAILSRKLCVFCLLIDSNSFSSSKRAGNANSIVTKALVPCLYLCVYVVTIRYWRGGATTRPIIYGQQPQLANNHNRYHKNNCLHGRNSRAHKMLRKISSECATTAKH